MGSVAEVVWEEDGGRVSCSVHLSVWDRGEAGMAGSRCDSDGVFKTCGKELQSCGMGECHVGMDVDECCGLLC